MPFHLQIVAILLVSLAHPILAAEPGDPERGRRAYRVCAACHSLAPDKNMTGPSLFGLWGRKAGGLDSFQRYSPELKAADFVWDDQTLGSWLADPARMVPGTRMTFRGIKDDAVRAALIAFLRQATRPDSAAADTLAEGGGGMMAAQAAPNLKTLAPANQVAAISLCRDTYRVATADGRVHEFWERNLRFKTDSSADGPEMGAPALLGAGMMGDRASIVFAAPDEMAHFIALRC